LHKTEGRISSNLLKRKQSSRKTSIVYGWLKSNFSKLVWCTLEVWIFFY